MAETENTTNPPTSCVGAPGTLPPVIELAGALAAIDAEHAEVDLRIVHDGADLQERMTTLARRGLMLRDLISTLPAVTLPDAAAQIGVASAAAGVLAVSDWSTEETQPLLRPRLEALHRMLLSVLPIVADAAGLDMHAMGWSDTLKLRASRFGGEVRS